MDKNKSRTDLLAAGRKTLQQFRQKKDGKGSTSGKTSKRSTKSEQHGSDASSTDTVSKSTVKPQVLEGEITTHSDSDSVIVDTSASQSTANSLPIEHDVIEADLSSETVNADAGTDVPDLVKDAELEVEELVVGDRNVDLSVPNDAQSHESRGNGVIREMPSGTADIPFIGREPYHGNEAVIVSALHQSDSVNSTRAATVQVDTKSPSEQGVHQISSFQERVHQKTDDANGSSSNKSDRSGKTALQGEGRPAVSEPGESSEIEAAPLAEMGLDGQTPVEKWGSNTYDVFSSYVATDLVEAHVSSVVGLQMKNQQMEDVVFCSSIQETQENASLTGGCRSREIAEGHQHLPAGSYISEAKSCNEPYATESASSSRQDMVSSVGDGSSINLSDLIESIRGLNEDEYNLVLRSRESVSHESTLADSLVFPSTCSVDLVEKVKEELYITNFTKDIFQFQLTELSDLQRESNWQHHQLLDEVSVLHASLSKENERNTSLAEELDHCRTQLQAVSSERDGLQQQCHAAAGRAKEYSVQARDFQISLERYQEHISALSAELAGSKNLIATLQLENQNLNGDIALLKEERQKLLEEQLSSFQEKERLLTDVAGWKEMVGALQIEIEKLNVTLASVYEGRNKLVEEKEYSLEEKEKLLSELTDCKNLVANLQVENSSLSGRLVLVTDGMNKLEEEKDFLVQENHKIFGELVECRRLMATLEVENTNRNRSIDSVTEKLKKIEEDREHFICENGRLNSELLAVQEKLSAEHCGCMQLEADLKEATAQIEQLMQENILLNSSLNMNKAKISEIDNQEYHMVEGGSQVCSSEMGSKSPEHAIVDAHCEPTAWKHTVEVSSVKPEDFSHDGPVEERKLELLEQEVFDTSSGFVVLNQHLEEVETMLQNLEKAIRVMCSRSISTNKSGSEMAAPGVSKLIQAFELKVHHDEHEEEDNVFADNWSTSDALTSVKELIGKLGAVIRLLRVDANNARILYVGQVESRKSAYFTFRELNDQFEALKESSESLEATNIELGILYEAVKQHLCVLEAKNSELEILYGDLKQKESHLRSANTELAGKIKEREARIHEMQSQFHDLQRSSDERASMLHEQLESCQREALKMQSILQDEWNSSFTQVVETVRRLDDCVSRFSHSSITTTGLNILERSNVIPSVEAAIKMIEDLHEKLEFVSTAYEATSSSYEEVNQKYRDLVTVNESATEILHQTYGCLKKLVTDSCVFMGEAEMNLQLEELSDPLDFSICKTFIDQLEILLSERLQLQSANRELNSELIKRGEEIEELRKMCLNPNVMQELINEVEDVVKLEDSLADSDKTHGSHLKSLVSLLVQKYKESEKQLNSYREEIPSKLFELEEKVKHLEAFKLKQGSEILALKESLKQAEEDINVAHSGLQEKINDLEQSEQRVSSLREKLSIAVAKGKGLVVQRDSLKQSLSETTGELGKCSEELQIKDARIHELEEKLKTCSEAGERVEALESELSYIRNSATALRESFLLKDSVLQRIEEILEDLDLPEHFHSRDIIEKVDWLARSATGNSAPLIDWDQKSSIGGSYSDTGFGTVDAWKDDVQPGSNLSEDLRRKYEELQTKFYMLAEQNEMLEQSLMERNQLVQRWEVLLDRINMPAHLRSVEPEDRFEWLGSALAEASHDRHSLQRKIDDLENYCQSLTADMEESKKRASEIHSEVQSIVVERDHLSERLEILSSDHENILAKVVQFEHENEELHSKASTLQKELVSKVERLLSIEGEVRKMQDLIVSALEDAGIVELVAESSSTAGLEVLLKKLIENYTRSVCLTHGNATQEHQAEVAVEAHDVSRSRGTLDSEELGVDSLNKRLEEALNELTIVKEERDRYLEKQLSLLSEVQALDKKKEEVQDQLHQEEQKSASVREKLNVAVRKGKSLVQQRDSLKQSIEAMNTELGHLKSEISQRENVLAQYEQKIMDLSSYPEKVEALRSENLMLQNHLAETERLSQDREHTLSAVLKTLCIKIDTGNPVGKLEQIVKECHELHSAVTASEQESRKAKKAAELLLAELNEVQERNDSLQEELEKSSTELAEIMRERDVAEAAKLDAVTQLQNLSSIHIEEKRKQYSEFRSLMSLVNQLRACLSDVHNLLSSVFTKDLEFLSNLGTSIKSCVEGNEVGGIVPLYGAFDGIPSQSLESQEILYWSETNMPNEFDENAVADFCIFIRQHLHELANEINTLKVKLRTHWESLREEGSSLANVIEILHSENASLKQSFEAMKREIVEMESSGIKKDMEIVSLGRNIALLYEACANLVVEIQRRKNELLQNNMMAENQGMNLNPMTIDGGLPSSGMTNYSSEEHVKFMTEKLTSVIRDFVHVQVGTSEGSLKEMKKMITNLQKELQEKDIQKESICRELVGQIKEAEATATSYSRDLHSLKALVHELEKQLEMMQEERKSIEEKAIEMQNAQATSIELEGKVKSLTDLVAAKDQEIESLMQALDEEEIQMDELTKNMKEQEKILQQKNIQLEKLEASRGKVVKKLSITVSKFDELHTLSESLLAEVEKLQHQLQDRDAEISFLRQEVTRCTGDVLVASQMSNKKDSGEIFELLTWFDEMVSPVLVHDVHFDDKRSSQANEYKEFLHKKVHAIICELEDLRGTAQSRDALLQAERSKVEELMRREETLKKTLHEKESQLRMLQGVGDLDHTSHLDSEIVEVRPVVNKWSVSGTSTASQVRSLRKVNNDEVAVAIEDIDPESGQLEDEDDDKAHGFKSLTTSRIVPKFTRPVTDMIDGLWVSCDRTLMRQPALRLGIMIYWALLHALLAAFVV